MASGDTLYIFYAWGGSLPLSTGQAQLSAIPTASISGFFQVAAFDPDTQEHIDFMGVMPDYYDGGGLTCTIIWSHEDNVNQIKWHLAFRRIGDDIEDLDLNHSYSYNNVFPVAPSVVGEISYDDITFTDGADMDSIAAGELFNARIYRDIGSGGTVFSKLLAIHIQET